MERLSKGIFLFAMVFLFVVASWAIAFGQEIKIGIAGPMAFEQGRQQWFGAEFGAGEINAKGGILVGNKRMPIKLVRIDTNEILNVPDAASAIERAITRDKVDFLMGGFRTEAVLAMQDVAMDYKKIFIGCGAAHPELCGRVAKDYNKYKYWFRTTPINSLFLLKVDLLLVGTVADAMRKELGITTPKVAIVAEKAVWADPIVGLGKTNLPKMGMEVVGEWRPSSTATDLTAELSAINASGAQMIFTTLSGPVGIPYAKTWGELKIPAASVGINVEAQKKGFLGATGGMGNYEMTQNTMARVEITPATIPFYDKFTEKAGEFPTYNAGTNDAILILAAAIERAGTLDSDKVVPELEKTNFLGAAGRVVFTKEHDVTWGPGYVTAMGTQWQFGELMGVWPYKWKATPEAPEITYKGSIPYKIPPWVVQKWKK